MWPFDLIKKRFKRIEIPKKEMAKRSALIRLGVLSSRINKKSEKRFLYIFRHFFSKFFGIHYEFTYDELLKELKTKKIKKELMERIGSLVKSLQEAMYNSKEPVEKAKLRQLINETRAIIKEL